MEQADLAEDEIEDGGVPDVCRQPCRMAQRFLERGDGLLVRILTGGFLGEPDQIGDRLAPELSLPAMQCERSGVRLDLVRVSGLQGPDHPGVQQRPAGRQKPAVRDLPDPLVREVEAFTPKPEETALRELFQRARGLRPGQLGRLLDERDVELPSNDGGGSEKLLAPGAQALEPSGDQLPDAFRKKGGPGLELSPFLERAQHLDHHEGIPLAAPPDLLPQMRCRTGRAIGPAR